MFVRRAARALRGSFKRGSKPTNRQRLTRAAAPVIEAVEARTMLSCTDGGGGASPTDDLATAVLSVGGGKTLVAGKSVIRNPDLTETVRTSFAMYAADGTLDATFGTGGKAVLDGLPAVLNSMTLTANGKVVAAGHLSSQFTVFRFMLDASTIGLDPEFNMTNRGYSQIDLFGSDATGVAVDATGRVIANGHSEGGVDYLVARFLPNGSLDTEFNDPDGDGPSPGTGYVVDDVAGADRADTAGGMALYDDGRIVTVGSSGTAERQGVFTLIRYTASGQRDVTFGVGGVTQTSIGSDFLTSDVGQVVKVLSDGKILAGGTAEWFSGYTSAIALARYDQFGVLDTSFGDLTTGGQRTGTVNQVIDAAGSGVIATEVKSMTLTSDGDIVVTGETSNTIIPTDRDIALVKFTATGDRVTSFDNDDSDGIDGGVVVDAGPSWDQAAGITLAANGDVIVAGRGGTRNTDGDFAVLRFTAAGAPAWGNGGVILTDFGTGTEASGAEIGGAPATTDEGAAVSLSNVCGVSGTWTVTKDNAAYGDPVSGTSFNFTPDDNGSYVVTLDVGGVIDTRTIAVTNVNPAVNAGPNLGVAEGTLVNLVAAVTDAGTADTHAFAWTVTTDNGDAITGGTGANFSFTPRDNGTYTVTVTATDDDGGASSSTLVVTVSNARPAQLEIAAPSIAVRQWEVLMSGSFTDAGAADTHTFAWRAVDAAGTVVALGNGINFRFTPVSSGFHTVTFTVTDDDGGARALQKQVDVRGADLVDGALRVGGTSLGDHVDLQRTTDGEVRVLFGGLSAGTFAPTGTILVRAGAGADDVTVASGFAVKTRVFGGLGNDLLRSGNAGDSLVGDAGNDTLLGNAGADVLVGGDGHDILVGGGGNDLLNGGKNDDLIIGGRGADSLDGDSNDDVIIAGYTSYDQDLAKLAGILAAWRGRTDYAAGVTAIKNAGLVADVTVFDDDARDVMTGDAGKDVFFGNFTKPDKVLDVITDLKGSEFAIDLD